MPIRSEPERLRRGRFWGTLAFAAGLALAAAACVIVMVAWIATTRSGRDYFETGIGGYAHLTLADGSVIQLNTNSAVRAWITAGHREVRVIRGEVLVEAAPDPARPLELIALGTTVRVAPSTVDRAALDIRIRAPGVVDVAVKQGGAIVGPSENWLDAALGETPFAHSSATTGLTAGDIVRAAPEGFRLGTLAEDDLDRKLSWTVGLLSFRGETLSEVAAEFNRYNRLQLVVADPSIATRRIGGAFQATDPQSFVAGLQKWFDIRAETPDPKTGAQIVRLSGAQPRH